MCNQKPSEQCFKQEKEKILVKKKKHRWINIWQNKILESNANGATENLMKMLIISILLSAKIIREKYKIRIISFAPKIKDIEKFYLNFFV